MAFRLLSMEVIKQHKLFIAIMVGLFIPSSLVGWVSGFVNWGVALLIGLALAVRWAYPRVRDFTNEVLAEGNEKEWWK